MLLHRKQFQCDKCPVIINDKDLNPNADVVRNRTSIHRAVNSIKYLHGGRVTYGTVSTGSNLGTNPNIRTPLLPLRNKF